MRRARYLLAIAIISLAGCGGDDSEQDNAELERDLVRTVEEQTGTRGVQVDCPKTGETCTVTAPGGVRSEVTRDGEVVPP